MKLRSRATGFAGGAGAYAVVITDAEGEDVACFELKTKAQRKAERKADRKHRDEAGDGASAGDEVHMDDEDELGEDHSAGDDDSAGHDGDVEDEPSADESTPEG